MGLETSISDLSACEAGNRQVIYAGSVGWKVDRLLHSGCRCIGRVHSVFNRACNIEAWDGQVFGLINGNSRHCLGINVEPHTSWSHVARGMIVVGDGNCLSIPECGANISLRGSSVWKAKLNMQAAPAEFVLRATRRAAALGYDAGNLEGLGGLLMPLSDGIHPDKTVNDNEWVRRADSHLHDLITALRGTNPEAAASAARFITGLGPGLTPSGDDLLTGLLGTWWWWEKINGGLSDLLQECFSGVSEVALKYTNVFGYQQIQCATGSDLSEVALDVVAALISGGKDLESCVAALLEVGFCSGTDMLAGICAALVSLCDEPAKNWG